MNGALTLILTSSEQEKRLFQLYGKQSAGRRLLNTQLKTRKYFDSGDFALLGANKASDIGVIQTGREHPLLENISHPSSPVPNNSNVSEGANCQMQCTMTTSLVKDASLLHHGTNMDEKKTDRNIQNGTKGSACLELHFEHPDKTKG